MSRPASVLALPLLALALVACASDPDSVSYRLEGCTVEQVFTCVVERDPDGRSFTVWLRNGADIPVLDVSVIIQNSTCVLERDETAVERVDPGTSEPLAFRCSGLVPPTLTADLDVRYTLVSGYAGDPPRLTRGDFVASASPLR
jgi:hypothetical protein